MIVDDKSSGFAKGGSYWREDTRGYLSHQWWTYTNGSAVDCWGEWRTSLGGGSYEVFVYVPRYNTTSLTAKYTIYHQGGTTVKTVNQNNYLDAWVSLGTYTFDVGHEHDPPSAADRRDGRGGQLQGPRLRRRQVHAKVACSRGRQTLGSPFPVWPDPLSAGRGRWLCPACSPVWRIGFGRAVYLVMQARTVQVIDRRRRHWQSTSSCSSA